MNSFSFNQNGSITLKEYDELAIKYNKDEPRNHKIKVDAGTSSNILDLCKVLGFYTRKKYGYAPVIECITPSRTSGADFY